MNGFVSFRKVQQGEQVLGTVTASEGKRSLTDCTVIALWPPATSIPCILLCRPRWEECHFRKEEAVVSKPASYWIESSRRLQAGMCLEQTWRLSLFRLQQARHHVRLIPVSCAFFLHRQLCTT